MVNVHFCHFTKENCTIMNLLNQFLLSQTSISRNLLIHLSASAYLLGMPQFWENVYCVNVIYLQHREPRTHFHFRILRSVLCKEDLEELWKKTTFKYTVCLEDPCWIQNYLIIWLVQYTGFFAKSLWVKMGNTK